MLGLGGAAIPAAADASKEMPLYGSDEKVHFGVEQTERIARALERMASELRAERFYLQEFEITSKARLEDYLVHRMTVEFFAKEDSGDA